MSLNQETYRIKGSFGLMEFLRRYNVGVTFTVLILIATFATGGNFFTLSNLLNVGERASIVGIVAMGQMLVILTGGIDLSVNGVMAVSFTLFAVLTAGSVPVGLALIISILAGSIFGAINGVLVAKTKIPPFMVTLSTMLILNSLALVIAQAHELRFKNLQEYINSFLGSNVILANLLPTVIWLIFSGLLLFMLSRTRVGMNIYAVGGREEAAFLSGIRATKTKIAVYAMSGTFSAIAALIFAYRLGSLNPISAESYQLESIAAVILGGANVNGGEGTVYGSFSGAILIAMLSNILNLLRVDPYLQYAIMGALLIIIIVGQKYLSKR